MRALLVVVWYLEQILFYTGGSHKSITGTISYFQQYQPQVGGVIKDIHDMGAPHNMYIMLCGRTTPAQWIIIRRRAQLDPYQYLDILN